MNTSLHPTPADLTGYALGTIDEASAESIADHLETCADCEATLANLESVGDTVVESLRRPVSPSDYDNEPELDRAAEIVVALGRDPTLMTRSQDIEVTAIEAGGQKLGQYQLLQTLGQGGMGSVYKALHTQLDKVVALKVLPFEKTRDVDAVRRFKREMRAVGKLNHPNIVAAHDAGEADGTHYLVMEYVEGIDLSVLVSRRGPLPVTDACELIRQAASGLQHARLPFRSIRRNQPMNVA